MNEEKTVSPQDIDAVGNRPLDDSELAKVVGGAGSGDPPDPVCDLNAPQPAPGIQSLQELGNTS